MIIWNLFKELIRRPLGLISGGILLLLYGSAVLANFLAPYTTNQQDLDRTYHPPTNIFFAEGGLRVQAYELIDPSIAKYEPIEGKSYALEFLGKGPSYRFLGLFETERQLVFAFYLGSRGRNWCAGAHHQ